MVLRTTTVKAMAAESAGKYERKPAVGSWWRHYKGNCYHIVAVARHSETEEDLVIYRRLDDESDKQTWARPLAMFMGALEDGRNRFERF